MGDQVPDPIITALRLALAEIAARRAAEAAQRRGTLTVIATRRPAA
jgi:hypothetical protein